MWLCQVCWCQLGLCDAICSDAVTEAFHCLGKEDQIKVKETGLHPIALCHLQMLIQQSRVLPCFTSLRHIAPVCAQSLLQGLPMGLAGWGGQAQEDEEGWGGWVQGRRIGWQCSWAGAGLMCGVQALLIPMARCQGVLVENSPKWLHHPVLYPPGAFRKAIERTGDISTSAFSSSFKGAAL